MRKAEVRVIYNRSHDPTFPGADYSEDKFEQNRLDIWKQLYDKQENLERSTNIGLLKSKMPIFDPIPGSWDNTWEILLNTTDNLNLN